MNTPINDAHVRVKEAVSRFVQWLNVYGETSYDHQTFFASPLGNKAKALYYKKPLLGLPAVAPMIFCEAFFPAGRQLFWKRQRLPIADAHYAMGFAFLYQIFEDKKYYDRAVHFLEVLKQTRCSGYQHYCWGYPFNWETRGGNLKKETPLITTTPYAYEAFLQLYEIDKKAEWLDILKSIAEHTFTDIKDFKTPSGACTCSYTPDDSGGVINASAYRAFLLTSASIVLSKKKYRDAAERNIDFVLENQQPNGSWLYAADSVRDFVDHFHTCFVLKALAKIEKLTGENKCTAAIEKGVAYYVKELFNEKGLPRPFSKAPRMTVYRHELYDYAECLNLWGLLRNRFDGLDAAGAGTLDDLLTRWLKPDGSFRSRKLLVGWDNVPMHRWAQSQVFRSLALLLYHEKQT